LNLLPGEIILEIDLKLNEILKKSFNISKLESIEQCTLRMIDLNDLVSNFNSFENLLSSIDIICIVSNSSTKNIRNTKKLLSNLKEKIPNVDYFIIANFQDKKELNIESVKIEELLGEKVFGFSAIQEDSKERIISIIEDILGSSIKVKEEFISSYDDIWSEIENARNFETQGDIIKASEYFLNVATQFKKIYSNITIKSEKEEAEVLYHLCKAWEFMLDAQEKVEPKVFLEASNHFIQASELVHDNRLKLLALGNSEFCKVLKLVIDLEKSNTISINSDYIQNFKILLKKMVDLYKQGGFEEEANWSLTISSYLDKFSNDTERL